MRTYVKCCGTCEISKQNVEYPLIKCKKHDTMMFRKGCCKDHEFSKAYRSLETKEITK